MAQTKNRHPILLSSPESKAAALPSKHTDFIVSIFKMAEVQVAFGGDLK